jgi:archaellum component FlaC
MMDECSSSSTDREELRDITTETRADVRHMNETLKMFIARMEECDQRVRNLEIYGGTLSQKSAKEIDSLENRVNNIESDFDIIRGAEKQAGRVAAIVAGIISIGTGIVGVIVSLLMVR